MKTLIIVDWQKEWTEKDSSYYLDSDLIEETNKINSIIEQFRKSGDKVIFLRHIEKEEDAFEENKNGSEFIDTLAIKEGDTVVKKFSISPFYNTNLEVLLKDSEEIIITGAIINACVRSLASDAYDRGFKITIIEDCCVAFDKETHDFTLKDIVSIRPEIEIMNSKDYLEKIKQ